MPATVQPVIVTPSIPLLLAFYKALLGAVEQQCAHWPTGVLHIERFAPKAPTADEAAEALQQFEVVCQRSGVTMEITPDESILEVLEAVEIPVLGSCYEGVWHL